MDSVTLLGLKPAEACTSFLSKKKNPQNMDWKYI